MAQEAFESITLGHMRSHGCRDLLVYCEAINCNHSHVMKCYWATVIAMFAACISMVAACIAAWPVVSGGWPRK